jgi:Ca-activated chloride channel homolog
MENWFSLDWFTWGKLASFSWESPLYAYLLLLPPIIMGLRYFIQRSSINALAMASIQELPSQNWTRYLRYIAPVFMLLSLTCIILALARPQRTISNQLKRSEGIDILLAMDISSSMLNKDLLPNRLQVAKKLVSDFVKTRLEDRIGLVAFSGEAFIVSPLTTDYDALADYISDLNPNLISTQGTAIGDALAIATQRLNEAKSKTKVLILLSDGDNTAGSIDPLMAAKIAKEFKVKIYALFVGNNATAQADEFNASIDKTQLAKIAEVAGGTYFASTNTKQLKAAFDQINHLEKVKFLQSSSKIKQDVYHVYLRWGIVFLLISFFTKITFMGNILED